MKTDYNISEEEARETGEKLKVSWDDYSFDEFHTGINVELEHGYKGNWNITDDSLESTAKIALAHLDEIPDYYTRLAKMEEEGKKDQKKDDTDTTDNSEADSEDGNGRYSESLAKKLQKTINKINLKS